MNQDDENALRTEVSRAALQILAELLQRRGLQAGHLDEWLRLSAAGIVIHCSADNFRSYPQGWLVQVSLSVIPEAEPTLVISDTNVGLGASLEAAVLEVVTTWLDAVFAPIQAALGVADDTSQVKVCELAISNHERGPGPWLAYPGGFQIRGTNERVEQLGRCLKDKPPLTTLLLDPLTRLLIERRESMSWIKLFLQLQPGGKVVAECKANNQDWFDGRDALANFLWPAGSEGMLFKQFVVITRGQSLSN